MDYAVQFSGVCFCYNRYREALDITNFKELAIHHDEICETLFGTIVNDNNHCLYKLLPAPHETTYSQRRV